jgi:hypothetical protein
MTRLGSFWLFFSIVAVGLVLSWGQVGRRTDHVLQAEPVVYLVNEKGCRPVAVPCAAVARDRALVLGPAGQGLALKQTGFAPGDLAEAEAVFLDAGDSELARRTLPPDRQAWLLAGIPDRAQSLRVRLAGANGVTVAEFPLN